ncbi:MAG: hypothetical protein ACR2FN_12060 [Chitinophagaceae bacterium]
MEELIQKLQNMHGLSAEQSHEILNTIAQYIKEKFPMLGGAVDNLFHTSSTSATSAGAAQTTAENSAQNSGSFLDQISDYVPGSAGEKLKEFAKGKMSGFGKNEE